MPSEVRRRGHVRQLRCDVTDSNSMCQAMTEKINISNYLLAAVGGIAGGALGYFAFFLVARQGLYALVLPGALLGLGCGYLSGLKSNLLGVICAFAALLLGLFTEWQFAPFVADDSLAFFSTHLHHLKTMTLVLIAIGAFFGYWFGKGRAGGVWPRHSES
jgi:hypothetical protein